MKKSMTLINPIPHSEQRYETYGDWQFDLQGNLEIHISDTEDENFNFLLGLHELIEAHLCKQFSIKQEEVDKWDLAHLNHPDPGSIEGCPYYRQHMMASLIERLLASELGINWDEYEEVLENL